MKSLALAGALLLASCSGQSTPNTASHASPSTASSVQATSASTSSPQTAGILIDLGAGNTPAYDLTVVRADGTVASTLHPKKRAAILASGISAPAAIELPYVSASGTRIYYLDGDATVKFLALDGSSGTVAQVPGTTRAHAAFAVSPNDKRMAVSVLDYSTTPPTGHLYVEDLGGTNRNEIFSSNSSYVWPIGWHAGQLVLAVGDIYSQQGVAWNPYDAAAYHVVDPTTAHRTATIGSGTSATGCQPTGLLSAAGTACFVSSPNQSVAALDWSGQRLPPGGGFPVSGQEVGSLSPDGPVAICCDGIGNVTVRHAAGSTQSTTLSGSSSDWVCWLDASHVLSGFTISSPQLQPAVVNLSSGTLTTVNARGFCAATLPGGQ